MEQEEQEQGSSPTLAIVGRKTERNELEDYWMEKVGNLERQYDEHLRFMQARLFDHRVDRKLVTRLREDNRYMKRELDTVRKQEKTLGEGLKAESEKHKAAKRQVGTVKARLTNALQEKEDLTRKLNRASKELIDSDKRQLLLSRKLANMEHDKEDLQHDVNDLRSKFLEVDSEAKDHEQERRAFAYRLSEIDTERRVQTKSNFRLLDKVEELVTKNVTKEEKLYQMQTEINRIMRELAEERDKGAVLKREHALTRAKLQDAKEEVEEVKATAEQQNRATQHWREEYEFARKANGRREKGDRNEITHLRGQMASLRLQIHQIEQHITGFEAERSRLAKQLEILPTLQKSLEQMTQANKQKRRQLMIPNAVPDEILDLDPFLYYAKLREKHAAEQAATRSRIHAKRRDQDTQYPHLSYEKEIGKLRNQIKMLDSQVRAAQRKENRIRVELEQKKNLQQELFWREKAMAAIEKDRVRMNKAAIKFAQEVGDRIGRGLPLDLLLGADMPGGDYEHLQTRLQSQIQAQQDRIDMLRRKSSLPKLVNLEKELKGIQMGQLLRMEDDQLQKNIDTLKFETSELERRTEIVKRIRPVRRPSMAPSVEAVAEEEGALSIKVGDEKDAIEEHFIPEEELLATISKQFSVDALRKKLEEGLGSSSGSAEGPETSSEGGGVTKASRSDKRGVGQENRSSSSNSEGSKKQEDEAPPRPGIGIGQGASVESQEGNIAQTEGQGPSKQHSTASSVPSSTAATEGRSQDQLATRQSTINAKEDNQTSYSDADAGAGGDERRSSTTSVPVVPAPISESESARANSLIDSSQTNLSATT